MTASTATIHGRVVAYRVRISRRARAWRLIVHPESGLTVVLPPRYRLDPHAIIQAEATWILGQLDRLGGRPRPACVPLRHGSALAYLGGTLRLLVGDARERAVIERKGESLLVCLTSRCSLASVVGQWYREQAHATITARLAAINAALGYTYRRVAIRDQKTRWASCSVHGHLAFNWRLIMAPLAVLDYVVVHELVHLVDLSHSTAYWTRVAAIDPDYRSHRRWLREYGRHLSLEDPTLATHPADPVALGARTGAPPGEAARGVLQLPLFS